MQSHLLDPAVDDDQQSQLDGYPLATDDDYPVASSYEALEALVAAPPIDDLGFRPEPLVLTRGAARHLAMQVADARLKQNGVPRAERRRLMFDKKARIFNFSDLARVLISLTNTQKTITVE